MTIRPDSWIIEMSKNFGMIEPFEPKKISQREDRGIISYGCSSFGYDIRAASEWKLFTNVHGTIVDPKNFDSRSFVSIDAEYVNIPPNSFALTRSLEYIRVPRDVLCLVLGKSTYARCGLICNFTPLEPGWRGYITIEISNSTTLPARVYANEGIAQVLFFQSDTPCRSDYGSGKYQDQGPEIVVPRT